MSESPMLGGYAPQAAASPHSGLPTFHWPFPDLYAATFRMQQDHTNGRLRITGLVGNQGNATPRINVWVWCGVTYRIQGVQTSTFRYYEMCKDLRPGEFAETTPPLGVPLAYFNEDNGAKYKMELNVDFTGKLIDLVRPNNYYSYTWLAHRPDALVNGRTFTFKDGVLQEDTDDSEN
jgi:hypothetical protein